MRKQHSERRLLHRPATTAFRMAGPQALPAVEGEAMTEGVGVVPYSGPRRKKRRAPNVRRELICESCRVDFVQVTPGPVRRFCDACAVERQRRRDRPRGDPEPGAPGRKFVCKSCRKVHEQFTNFGRRRYCDECLRERQLKASAEYQREYHDRLKMETYLRRIVRKLISEAFEDLGLLPGPQEGRTATIIPIGRKGPGGG